MFRTMIYNIFLSGMVNMKDLKYKYMQYMNKTKKYFPDKRYSSRFTVYQAIINCSAEKRKTFTHSSMSQRYDSFSISFRSVHKWPYMFSFRERERDSFYYTLPLKNPGLPFLWMHPVLNVYL